MLFQLTLPYNEHPPSQLFKFGDHYFISLNIFINFFIPKFSISLWPLSTLTVMAMPKTTVYKNNCFVFWQDYIWFSRKILTIYPKSKTGPMQNAS